MGDFVVETDGRSFHHADFRLDKKRTRLQCSKQPQQWPRCQTRSILEEQVCDARAALRASQNWGGVVSWRRHVRSKLPFTIVAALPEQLCHSTQQFISNSLVLASKP